MAKPSKPKKPRAPWRRARCVLAWAPTVWKALEARGRTRTMPRSCPRRCPRRARSRSGRRSPA
eukprot:3158046-Pyramimonas_sp.AAC.1